MSRTFLISTVKSMLLSAGLAVIVLTPGCTPEVLVPDLPADRVETLSLNIEGGTKASVNASTGAVSSQVGDDIAVLTSAGVKTCNVTASGGNYVVEVPLTGSETRQGYAVYPASGNQTLTTSSVAVNYPNSYNITGALNSENVTIPMVAVNSSNSTTLAFKQIGGIMKMTVLVPAGTRTVTVTTSGSPLCGVATVSNPGTNPTSSITSGGGNTVTFTVHASGLDATADIVLNLPVPCGTYTSLAVAARNSSNEEIGSYSDNTTRIIGRANGRLVSINIALELASVTIAGLHDVAVGETLILSATATASNSDDLTAATTFKWYSRDSGVATVEENTGVITPVSGGTARIYATGTYNGIDVNSADFSVAVNGSVFSVSASKKIVMSHGNLKVDDGTYSFHANEYDMCFPNNTGWNTTNRDIFQWSEIVNNDTADNPKEFQLGGRAWYTLKKTEWDYLLSRTTSTVNGTSNARYAKARIQTGNNTYVYGLILFPDVYTQPTGLAISNINSASAAFSGNTYTTTQWTDMSNAGAVFLPASGYYSYQDSKLLYTNERGLYWSCYRGTTKKYYFRFSSSYVEVNNYDTNAYYSVRLVRNYTPAQ